MFRRLVCVCAMLHASGGAIAAQDPPDLNGSRVEVELQRGLNGSSTRVKGRLVGLGPVFVDLETKEGPASVPLSDVAGFKTARPRRQVLRGLGIGLGGGALASLSGDEPSPAFVAGAAAAGALVGYFIRRPELSRAEVSALRPHPVPGTVIRFRGPDTERVVGTLEWANDTGVAVTTADGVTTVYRPERVSELQWRSGRTTPSPVPPLLLGVAGGLVGHQLSKGACEDSIAPCAADLAGAAGLLLGMGIGLLISYGTVDWRWESATPNGSSDEPAFRVTVVPAGAGVAAVARLTL